MNEEKEPLADLATFERTAERSYQTRRIPGIDALVRYRSLTHAEVRALSNSLGDDADERDMLVALIQACVVNENGHRLFSDGEADAQKIDGWNSKVIAALGRAILDFVGVSDEELEALKKN